jgi:pimeloyl-ACP methyl ester carboxylesterase
MHYVEAGPPDAPAVILLHGFPDSWQVWEALIPALAPDYHVFALDQRGHGDTDKPRCCYAPADFAGDVAAFMDARGIGRAAIVGHSLGSFVAQNFAVAHGERVERLVLVGSGVAFDNAVGVEFRASLPTVPDAPDLEMVREFQRSTLHRMPDPEAFERLVAQSMKVPGYVWRGVAALLGQDRSGSVGGITAPTLMIAGDRDALFPLDEQHRLFRLLANAELACYADTGHFIQLEQPARFAADLREFLAGSLAAAL